LSVTVLSNGVLLPCSTLKDTAACETVKLAGLTAKVSGTESEFEACTEAMATLQL
jgi:ATP-dependent phosphoenolpyruvate carboxykinase